MNGTPIEIFTDNGATPSILPLHTYNKFPILHMYPRTESNTPIHTDQDTLVFTSEESEEEPFNTAIDNTLDDSTIIIGKPVTTAFISSQVCIPTEKVGCLQVTSQLQEFLNHFSPKSVEKAFKQIYQILQA